MSTAAHDLAHSRTTALVVDEIRAQMARRRLSQVALAKRLGVPQPWLNRRLMGHTPISLDDLDRIAHGLDVTFTELVLAADRNAISLRHGDDAQGWLHGHRAIWRVIRTPKGHQSPVPHADRHLALVANG